VGLLGWAWNGNNGQQQTTTREGGNEGRAKDMEEGDEEPSKKERHSPHALQIGLPSASRRHNGVSVVPQLTHGVRVGLSTPVVVVEA
jgi:hypothetical protein